jgi:hypothetical protein
MDLMTGNMHLNVFLNTKTLNHLEAKRGMTQGRIDQALVREEAEQAQY